jgi:DNA-binding transcriptional LysR family regulator
MVDVRLMQAAIALAEELNFSRAAARLNITQSALTKQIKELEERVGRELFRRSRQSVEVTEAGKAFVEEARLALLHTERAMHSARLGSESNEAILRLGKSPYTDPFLVTTALSIRLPLYPDLKLNLSSNFSPILIHQLLAGSLDVAILSGIDPPVGLSCTRIATAPLYGVLETADELAERPELRLADLHGRHWVWLERHAKPQLYGALERVASSESSVPLDLQHVTTAEEALPLISANHAIAVLPRTCAWRIARDGITIRPIGGEQLSINTYIAVRPDNKSRVVSDFVRSVVRKLISLRAAHQERLPLSL